MLMMKITLMVMASTLMTMMFYQMNKMEKWDNSNSSAFECGFNSLFSSRFSFSIPYMFLCIMFLFLDLEFCMVLTMMFKEMSIMDLKITMMIISVIMLSLIIEWNKKMMDWTK